MRETTNNHYNRENMLIGPGQLQDSPACGARKPFPGSMECTLQGSLTIESSLVIPIFIFTMFMILSVINLLRFHLNLQEAVHQETKKLALSAYDGDFDCSVDSVRSGVLSGIDDKLMEKAPVRNGAGGIDFSGSRLDNRELIEINASYEAKLPYDSMGLFDYQFAARCVMHTYTGYEKGLSERDVTRKEEEYVYVTRTGTVYHKDRECTYLRLSIKETSRDSLKDLRNSSGHKYYACEKCGRKAGSSVYITSDGTCYHSSLSCSGLKRSVSSIPLSEAGGKHACSRCSH